MLKELAILAFLIGKRVKIKDTILSSFKEK